VGAIESSFQSDFTPNGVGMNPFAYSSYSLEIYVDLDAIDVGFEYKIDDHLYHRHSEILGLNVANTYDSPAVLFNLIKSYCILNRVVCIDDHLYSLQAGSFYKLMGSLS